MKIFLTGASGYVGAVVAEKLKGRGHKIIGLARNDEAAAKLDAQNIETVRGELGDYDVLKNAARDVEAVVHTAFSHNFADYKDAVKLDREVIKIFGEALAQTNKPLIITSSSAILGDTRTNEADEDYPFDQKSSRLPAHAPSNSPATRSMRVGRTISRRSVRSPFSTSRSGVSTASSSASASIKMATRSFRRRFKAVSPNAWKS